MSKNGINVSASTSSMFQYVTKSSYVESNMPEVLGALKENILSFSTKFESGELTRPYLAKISQELVSTARYFGEQQGLTNILNFFETDIVGNNINFRNVAQDEYGRYYAGHIEYGHYSRGRKTFIPARPFMRPALYAVSKASQGELEQVLGDMLMTIFRDSKNGYQGISNLTFSDKLGSLYQYTTKSNDIYNRLSSQKIFEVDEGKKRDNYVLTGKDLNTMPNFEKRMGAWSIKRGQNSSLQRKLRSDAGWRTDGKSHSRAVQLANDHLATSSGKELLHRISSHWRGNSVLHKEKKVTREYNQALSKGKSVNWKGAASEKRTSPNVLVGQGPILRRGNPNQKVFNQELKTEVKYKYIRGKRIEIKSGQVETSQKNLSEKEKKLGVYWKEYKLTDPVKKIKARVFNYRPDSFISEEQRKKYISFEQSHAPEEVDYEKLSRTHEFVPRLKGWIPKK